MSNIMAKMAVNLRFKLNAAKAKNLHRPPIKSVIAIRSENLLDPITFNKNKKDSLDTSMSQSLS